MASCVQLMDALEVASFKDVGNAVNETVSYCHRYWLRGLTSIQINWEESANAARVCIRPHIDEDLDKLKHIYHGIDTVLV